MLCPLLMRRSIILSRLIACMGCTRVCALLFGPCMIYERKNFNLTCKPQKRPWRGSKLTTTTTPAKRSHDSAKISPGFAGLLIGTIRPRMPRGRRHFPQVLLGKMKENVSPRPRGWFIGSELIGKCVCVCAGLRASLSLIFLRGAVKLMAKRSLFGPLLLCSIP